MTLTLSRIQAAPDRSQRVKSPAYAALLALSAIATVVAFVRVRVRRDLWLGGAVLTAVPLAMAILGMAVWLLARSRRAPRRPSSGAPYPTESTPAEVHEDPAEVV